MLVSVLLVRQDLSNYRWKALAREPANLPAKVVLAKVSCVEGVCHSGSFAESGEMNLEPISDLTKDCAVSVNQSRS